MEERPHPYDTIADAFSPAAVPRDLLFCVLWLAGAILAIYVPYLNESFLRVVFGIPLVLFIPGYALIAALFPGAGDIDGIERVALSFGLSIALVPLTGLALNYTPFGIRLDPIVIALSILTLGLCLAAQYRRARLPPGERFSVPFRELGGAVSAEFFPKAGSSRTDRILSLVLLVALVAAVAATVFVIVVPKEGEKFTEFFILGENRKAADYPSRLFTGVTSSPLFIGIGNHEYRTVTYTVETYLVNMTFNTAANTTTLDRMQLLDRFTLSIPHNETVIRPYTFAAATASFNRVEFLLFDENVPDDRFTGMERINRSYRDLHLWVTVRSPS
jgi:uncharacterized membrane protein